MLQLKLPAAALALAVSVAMPWSPGSTAPSHDPALHFELARSVPAAGSMVHGAPAELRLWFTATPQDGTTAVRITDSGGKTVPTGAVSVDPEDAASFQTSFSGALAAGRYTVAWRAMGPDGHVVTGEFEFSVMIMDEGP